MQSNPAASCVKMDGERGRPANGLFLPTRPIQRGNVRSRKHLGHSQGEGQSTFRPTCTRSWNLTHQPRSHLRGLEGLTYSRKHYTVSASFVPNAHKVSIMGAYYETIPESLIEWIRKQKLFYVASAPLSGKGHVNVSPKGGCVFAVDHM